MARKTKRYQLKLPSQTDILEIIREFVAKIATKTGLSEEDVSKIELAVDEACANVVKHAYGGEGGKPIEVVVTVDSRKFTVIVTDKGKGFDLHKLKKPDIKQYIANRSKGGLGIHLMQTLMDEIDFKIDPGHRNQVRLVKYLEHKSNTTTRAT